MQSYPNSLSTRAMICSLNWGLLFPPTFFQNEVVLIHPLIRLDHMGGRRNHFAIDCYPNGIVDSID